MIYFKIRLLFRVFFGGEPFFVQAYFTQTQTPLHFYPINKYWRPGLVNFRYEVIFETPQCDIVIRESPRQVGSCMTLLLSAPFQLVGKRVRIRYVLREEGRGR